MIRSNKLAESAETFRQAAMGMASWDHALTVFSDALDTRTGQLIAFGQQSLVPLNIMTRMPEEAAAEFVAAGGGNPLVNSRVRLGLASPELQVLDDADFTLRQDRERSPEFGEWIDRYGIGYTCITTLLREEGSLFGLAALRSSAQDSMNRSEKEAFMTLASHARAAVRLRNSVEDQAIDLLAAALDQTNAAVAICDIGGRVRAMTSRGEKILTSGRFARLVDGHVLPNRSEERATFQSRLAAALQSREQVEVPPPQPMVLTDRSGNAIVVEIVPLPADHSFTFAASVMIVFPGDNDAVRRRTAIARELFGLTETEELVAANLLRGRSPNEIASTTGRTVGTVRNHVHRILSKSECTSQVEFLAFMGRFD